MSYAFPNQDTPPYNLGGHIGEIVKGCGGLPLTLEVVGKWLRETRDEEDWRQALHALERAEEFTDFHEQLWEKLRVSYDRLRENEKEILLDATTFFQVSEWKFRMAPTLRDAKAAWRAAYGVSENLLWRTLVDRFLVYDVKEEESIRVHEQLLSLGQKIAAGSNAKRIEWDSVRDGIKRTRRDYVSDGSERQHELNNKKFHALRLPMTPHDLPINHAVQHDLDALTTNPLKILRYVHVENQFPMDSIEGFHEWVAPNLVLLYCFGVHVGSDRTNLQVRQRFFFPARQTQVGQYFFDPAHQTHLVVLVLKDFYSECLPKSIGELSALRIFRLVSSPKLYRIPDEIGQLSQLEVLELFDCNLQALPDTFGELSNLKDLRIEFCYNLRALPKSIGNLPSLDHLELNYCPRFQTLPETIGQLFRLTYLQVNNCKALHSLPKSLGSLSALVKLVLNGCTKRPSLPKSLGDFTNRQYFEMRWHAPPIDIRSRLYSLPDLLADMNELPDCFAEMKSLRHLVIGHLLIKSIPDSIKNLPALHTLEFTMLPFVKALPPWLGKTGRSF